MNRQSSIQTFIFCDVGSVGLPNNLERSLHNGIISENWEDHFEETFATTDRLAIPRMTRMSLGAISREKFHNSVLRKETCVNFDTVRNWSFGISMPEDEIEEHKKKISPCGNSFYHFFERKEETFKDQWLDIRNFLESLPQPYCLISHNGIDFNFMILRNEMREAGVFPYAASEMYCVDSLMGFHHIHDHYFDIYNSSGGNGIIEKLLKGRKLPQAIESWFTNADKSLDSISFRKDKLYRSIFHSLYENTCEGRAKALCKISLAYGEMMEVFFLDYARDLS